MRTTKKIFATVAVVSALTVTAACGSDEPADTATDETTSEAPAEEETPVEEETPAEEETEEAEEMDPAANLVGSGCAGYAEAVPKGAGSVAGMAKDPVAVAASNNPILKTLTASVPVS